MPAAKSRVSSCRRITGHAGATYPTPSSDMIVPAITSSIASSPVIIPPCRSWCPKRPGRARPALRHARTRDGPAQFAAARAFSTGSNHPSGPSVSTFAARPPGPALGRSGEGGRLRKIEGSGDLWERQLRVGYELPDDFESELVEHGPHRELPALAGLPEGGRLRFRRRHALLS